MMSNSNHFIILTDSESGIWTRHVRINLSLLPEYMGPHLVGLQWLGVTQMSGGWHCLEASSLTCRGSGLGWPEGWVQLELSAGAFPCGLGFLTEWKLRVAGCLKWEPEAPRASMLASEVKGIWPYFTRIYQSEQSQACPDSRGGHRPYLLIRDMYTLL